MWLNFSVLLASIAFLPSVYGLGCIVKICDQNANNELRTCSENAECGSYGGTREDGRIIKGVDIKCESNLKMHAPFDGQMYFWRPFGGQKGKECADKGVRIEGEGQWQGYIALVAFVKPNFYGGQVKQGAIIGDSIALSCLPDPKVNVENYIQFRLYRSGKVVDPTYHLKDCKCTGQICESNDKNILIGLPYKSDTAYNGVKGWELKCEMADRRNDPLGNTLDPDQNTKRAAIIFSPIEGEILGRQRLWTDAERKYIGCANDAIFIVGAGAWKGYTVRIYNARVKSNMELGQKRVTQGMAIGERLTCEDSPNSIFVEFRYNGRLANVTDMIMAKNCKAPDFD